MSGCEIGAMGAVSGVEMREQCRCVQEVKECMNSVRVCTGDKEITKSSKNGVTN